ncbi:polyprotein [Hirsutella rhossiliensis]
MRRTSLCGDMGSTGPTREGGFIGGSRKTFGPGLHASLHSSLPSFFSSFLILLHLSLLFIDYQYNMVERLFNHRKLGIEKHPQRKFASGRERPDSLKNSCETYFYRGSLCYTHDKNRLDQAGQTEGIRVIQPQEDVRLRQPISAQEFMRGTDFAADFSAIDPQLRFKDISVDNITEIHATTYAAKALKAYTLEKMWDDEVFHAFQQDFEGWTLDMFLMVEISYRRELRRVLRRKGVYTGTNHQRIERSLIKLLEADRFPTWDPQEFTKQIFDPSQRLLPERISKIRPKTSHQGTSLQPKPRLCNSSNRLFQGPQRPPEQAQQMTPKEPYSKPHFPRKAFPRHPHSTDPDEVYSQAPYYSHFLQGRPSLTGISRTRPCPRSVPNERLDPAVSAQFLKTFDKDQNPGDPILCDDTFAIAYHKVKTHFDTDVNHHHYYTDWTTATFELFDPTKHRGTRIFKSRLVREVKGKYIKPYEKSRLVVQGYNDDEKNTLLTQSPTIQRASQRLIIALAPTLLTSVLTYLPIELQDKYQRGLSSGSSALFMALQKQAYIGSQHTTSIIGSSYGSFGIVGMQTDDTLILGTAGFSVHEENKIQEAKFIAKPKTKLLISSALDFNGCTLALDEKGRIHLKQKGQAKKIALINVEASDRMQKYMEQRARGAYIASICQPEATCDIHGLHHLNKRLKWQQDNLQRGIQYDLSSQIGFLVMLVNENKKAPRISTKCKRVTRSVLASEIYGMTDGFDISLAILGTTKEKRLMIDIMALRQSYERREILEVRWINGNDNPADAMTKASPNKALERFISTNQLTIRVEGSVHRPIINQLYCYLCLSLKEKVASV